MRLPVENYYQVDTALIGGLIYMALGSCMALLPQRWPEYFFLSASPLAKKVRFIGLTPKNVKLIRSLGIFFSLVVSLPLYEALEHHTWIKQLEPLS